MLRARAAHFEHQRPRAAIPSSESRSSVFSPKSLRSVSSRPAEMSIATTADRSSSRISSTMVCPYESEQRPAARRWSVYSLSNVTLRPVLTWSSRYTN